MNKTIQINKFSSKKKEDVDKKIPYASEFSVTQEINRLVKINFDARIEETSKKLATKSLISEIKIEKKEDNLRNA